MSRVLLLLLLIGAMVLDGAAGADQLVRSGVQRNRLLELYTSEGCSSCPPADAWVAALKDDPALWEAVVPVVLHVTYWDYLGWSDAFADRRHDVRQRRLAAASDTQVYTPGVFLDGREWRGWRGRAPGVPVRPVGRKGLGSAAAPGQLELAIGPDRLVASYRPTGRGSLPGADDRLSVRVAWLHGARTAVRAGENRGRSLRHEFTVARLDEFDAVRREDGYRGVANLTVPSLYDSPAVAVWVEDGSGRILQAAGAWLESGG